MFGLRDGGGWVVGMRAKKVFVRQMGLSFLALHSKFRFFPRGTFIWFWVGRLALGGGGPPVPPPPPPPVDKHIPGVKGCVMGGRHLFLPFWSFCPFVCCWLLFCCPRVVWFAVLAPFIIGHPMPVILQCGSQAHNADTEPALHYCNLFAAVEPGAHTWPAIIPPVHQPSPSGTLNWDMCLFSSAVGSFIALGNQPMHDPDLRVTLHLFSQFICDPRHIHSQTDTNRMRFRHDGVLLSKNPPQFFECTTEYTEYTREANEDGLKTWNTGTKEQGHPEPSQEYWNESKHKS